MKTILVTVFAVLSLALAGGYWMERQEIEGLTTQVVGLRGELDAAKAALLREEKELNQARAEIFELRKQQEAAAASAPATERQCSRRARASR